MSVEAPPSDAAGTARQYSAAVVLAEINTARHCPTALRCLWSWRNRFGTGPVFGLNTLGEATTLGVPPRAILQAVRLWEAEGRLVYVGPGIRQHNRGKAPERLYRLAG